MDIEVFAFWKGQTPEEREAQCATTEPHAGHLGTLCEHVEESEFAEGDTVALRVLCREAFAAPIQEAAIPAALLRERLPAVLEQVDAWYLFGHEFGDQLPAIKESFTAFVELCEQKERETGMPCVIRASF